MTPLLAILLLSAGAAPGNGITPYGLECEARRDPVGIDALRPRLGWKLRSDRRNQRQTAYQVVVAASPEALASGNAEVWDSGRVASEQVAWIPYGGAALRAFQRYWWKVRVWDGDGQTSPWSEPALWTMAAPGQWRAAWIAHPDSSLRSGPLPIFRKEVAIDKPLRRALALVSSPGFHELRINGVKAGDHVLAPAWTNYRATIAYETHDVTAMLHTGANALGVLIGNGFYNVAGGRYTKYTGSFGHPRVAIELYLEFEDGTTRSINADATWRVHDGPLTFSCIFGGEDYDARLELPGWDRPGFDDSTWPKAVRLGGPGGVLRAQVSPPIRVQQTFSPVRVTEPKPGVRVYDLGQNFAGWPKITVSGPAGAKVLMTPGELLDSAGLVTQRSSGGPVSFTYTLRGEGRETWSPRFTYYGFRYVQVEGDVVPQQIEGQFVHLDAPRIGRFSCSNDLFNRIHTLIDAAVRSNLQHVLTDCPHREKLGWLEQAHLMGSSLLYNWDLRTFFPKVLRDIREAQLVDGLIPDIAPEYVVFGGGFRDSPEWGSAGVLVPWMAWEWYGDRQALADSYRSMKAYAGYLASQAKSGLLTHGLGDWYDIGPGSPGASQLTPRGVTATAVYYQDLRVLERAARLLDHPEEARQFAAEAAEVAAAFQKAFYKPAEGTYATGSQTSLAMPLALGLAPEAARPALVEKLVADIRGRGNHTSAGDVGYRYVLEALLASGRSDVVFEMANQTTKPSYAAQLAAGATALAEAWDADPRSSQNHLMLGHIEQWFWAGLAGICPDPEAPGLSRIRIQPEPVGDVKWVKASWETFRGTVAVDWKMVGGTFQMQLDVPPGITAEVRLPSGSKTIVGSGRHEFQDRR
ncbi:MAG TPA: family 78 glycoside hydrolase catalytic domain [Bryobacteraceae bacterium]|nr:family 78 glycoside hydrolase catalytic domain [Bryobacteraceae bacterium]